MGSLVTSRNNSDPPSWTQYDTPLRELRPYVQKCCTGTLALLYSGSRVRFSVLTCGSWSCPTCRKIKGAQLLDQLNRGMRSRGVLNRVLMTLTVNPSRYGARPAGKAYWNAAGQPCAPSEAVRTSQRWHPPTRKQFDAATADMSKEWNRLNDRLGRKAKREEVDRHGYFRVVELHRNVWPHYHAVLEHPTWTAADIQKQLEEAGATVEIK